MTEKIQREYLLDTENKRYTVHPIKEKEMYDTDIETLSTEIIQMILFNRIIYSDEDGVDIRTKELLEENKK